MSYFDQFSEGVVKSVLVVSWPRGTEKNLKKTNFCHSDCLRFADLQHDLLEVKEFQPQFYQHDANSKLQTVRMTNKLYYAKKKDVSLFVYIFKSVVSALAPPPTFSKRFCRNTLLDRFGSTSEVLSVARGPEELYGPQ